MNKKETKEELGSTNPPAPTRSAPCLLLLLQGINNNSKNIPKISGWATNDLVWMAVADLDGNRWNKWNKLSKILLKIIWWIWARPWSTSSNSLRNIRHMEIICWKAIRPRWLAGLDRTSHIVTCYFIQVLKKNDCRSRQIATAFQTSAPVIVLARVK